MTSSITPSNLTLTKIATHTLYWKRDAQSGCYQVSGHPFFASYVELTPQQLDAVDPRLAPAITALHKMEPKVDVHGIRVSQTVRHWLTPNPMPVGSPFLKSTYLDSVEEIQLYSEELQRIKLTVQASEIKIVDGVPLAVKKPRVYQTLAFDEIEPYYPNFQARLKVAQGLNFTGGELLNYVFPVAYVASGITVDSTIGAALPVDGLTRD